MVTPRLDTANSAFASNKFARTEKQFTGTPFAIRLRSRTSFREKLGQLRNKRRKQKGAS